MPMINDNFRKIFSECSQQMVKYSHLQSTILKKYQQYKQCTTWQRNANKHRKTMNEIK